MDVSRAPGGQPASLVPPEVATKPVGSAVSASCEPTAGPFAALAISGASSSCGSSGLGSSDIRGTSGSANAIFDATRSSDATTIGSAIRFGSFVTWLIARNGKSGTFPPLIGPAGSVGTKRDFDNQQFFKEELDLRRIVADLQLLTWSPRRCP